MVKAVEVGIIGVGKMGLPIAVNLIERGHVVTGYRRSGCEELVAAGGFSAGSSAEVAATSDVIVSILPDAEALEEVVLGPGGTLERLRPGAVHLEMSTIDVARKARVRDAVVAAGGDLLDAPISGSPGMVAPRLATTFVSGDGAAIERARPVLDAISGPWVSTGAFGNGARTKYLANLLVAVHTAAAAEAYALARAWDLDLAVLQETLAAGIAGSAVLRQRGPVMEQRAWLPAPGPVATLHAILEQIEAAASATGADIPVFGAAKAVFDRAVALGWSELDIAAVHDLATGQDALAAGPPADGTAVDPAPEISGGPPADARTSRRPVGQRA